MARTTHRRLFARQEILSALRPRLRFLTYASAAASSVISASEICPMMASSVGPDAIKHRVFRRFAQAIIALQAAIFAVQIVVRGPLHPNTLASVGVIGVFAALLAYQPRLRSTVPMTAIGMGVCATLSIFLERVTDGEITMMQFFMFSFPMVATLLANRHLGFAFLVVALADALHLLFSRPDGAIAAAAGVAVVAKFCFGAALVVLVETFDRERIQARRLAESREESLKEAVARAEHAAAARTLFLANMSHEIRTPMNGVLGLSRVLVDRPLPAAERDLAKTILESGKSLLHVLDDVLDLSKLDAGALQIEPQPVEMREIVRQVVQLMKAKADEAGIRLEAKVAPEVPDWIRVDGHRVRQVTTNLLSNAIKFTPAGTVTVEVSHANALLRVSVTDTGIGMDQETLGRIFNPFEQAEAGTARKYWGTGLGLAICNRLCQLMGGQLTASSELGGGSTFAFEVDAPVEHPPNRARQRDQLLAPLDLRVLVADDTPVNQLVVRHFLQKLGSEVRIVSNGAEAIDAVQEEDFDIVLMDLQMPKVDGFEATQRIRGSNAPGSKVPIIAFTASVMAEQRAACFAAGMDAVLTKPLELEALHETLGRLKSRGTISNSPSGDLQSGGWQSFR